MNIEKFNKINKINYQMFEKKKRIQLLFPLDMVKL